MARSETAEQISNAAERLARTGGYNSFSFRDIAGEIGIKSAVFITMSQRKQRWVSPCRALN